MEAASQPSEDNNPALDIKMGVSCSVIIDEPKGLSAPRRNPFSERQNSCIYIVDKRMRNQKPDAYRPDTVSIGPYHHDKNDLQMQAMEILKSQYLETLMNRTGISRDKYKEAIEAVKPDRREYYSDQINLFDKEKFLEIMLVDGVFIIELFRKYAMVGYAEVDAYNPVFNSKLKLRRVVRDLVLLENQMPMSVLQTLFNMSENSYSDGVFPVRLALYFFDALIPAAVHSNLYFVRERSDVGHKHLLDLLSVTLEDSLHPFKEPLETSTPEIKPCMTELQDSGIRFKSRPQDVRYCSFMDLSFNEIDRVFEIPPIYVSDYTDPFFHSLIAYEQHRYEGRHCMTSYALLMDYLINSAADVAILRDRGIISNHLGDDEKVASLFNNLCGDISTDNFIYGELRNDIRKYYKCFHKEKANSKALKKLSSASWKIISGIVAAIILLLSLWSALFAAFPVFNVSFKH